MLTYALPVLYALGLWWGSTIAILYLNGLPRQSYRWSFLGISILTVVAFVGMVEMRNDTSMGGVYHAFTCGVIAWAWQVASFYMGFVTGPSKAACDPSWSGIHRFREALRTCLHHELAVVGMAAVILLLLWGAANQVALWTYLILWWMHTSAKLNVFFGVRNLGVEFIPHHLRYILSYMSCRPMNALFPFSISASTIATILLVQHAAAGGSDWVSTSGFAMLSTLMILALLEHWLLVTPFDLNMLWRWGVKQEPTETGTAIPARPASASISAQGGGSGRGGDLVKLKCV